MGAWRASLKVKDGLKIGFQVMANLVTVACLITVSPRPSRGAAKLEKAPGLQPLLVVT